METFEWNCHLNDNSWTLLGNVPSIWTWQNHSEMNGHQGSVADRSNNTHSCVWNLVLWIDRSQEDMVLIIVKTVSTRGLWDLLEVLVLISVYLKHIFKKHVTGSEETSREKMIEVNTSLSVMYWTYEWAVSTLCFADLHFHGYYLFVGNTQKMLHKNIGLNKVWWKDSY